MTKSKTSRHKKAVSLWGSECPLCGITIVASKFDHTPDALTLDHVQPVSLGGPGNLQNLRPAHSLCNRLRGNRLLSDVTDAERLRWRERMDAYMREHRQPRVGEPRAEMTKPAPCEGGRGSRRANRRG